MAFKIVKQEDGRPMRHNDGAMVIMQGEPDDDDYRPALNVPMTARPKRGEAWRTSDPDQEAFAQAVVDALNAAGVAHTPAQA